MSSIDNLVLLSCLSSRELADPPPVVVGTSPFTSWFMSTVPTDTGGASPAGTMVFGVP